MISELIELGIKPVRDAFGFSESRDSLRRECADNVPFSSDVKQDEEIETIYTALERDYGSVNYQAWLGLLVSDVSLLGKRCNCELIEYQVDITKDDASSPEQVREAFRGLAGDKVGFSQTCDAELQAVHPRYRLHQSQIASRHY